ncbi:hypothetical protein [Pseudidiomarina donghaiensis]
MRYVKSLLVFLVLFASFNVLAATGGQVTMMDEGERVQLEFLGKDLLRINDNSGQGYMIMRDAKLYTVMQEAGQTMVFDLSAMAAITGGNMEESSVWGDEVREVLEISNTGSEETVAGIVGEVFTMRYVDSRGTTQSSTMVLTKNETVVAMSQSMHEMTKLLIQASNTKVDKSITEMEQHILGKGYGVLKLDDGF